MEKIDLEKLCIDEKLNMALFKLDDFCLESYSENKEQCESCACCKYMSGPTIYVSNDEDLCDGFYKVCNYVEKKTVSKNEWYNY